MKKRVLITGGTGLIGRRTVLALKQAGYYVIALSRAAAQDGADLTIQCDLLDDRSTTHAIAQAEATHLVHLAWHDAPQGRWTAAENVDWAAASLHLVRQFAAYGGRHMVGAGSCAEYDWSYEVLTETTPLNPSTLYGKAKAATGTLLTQAATDLGLTVAWARIFFCYGPGEPRGRLLGDLIHGLRIGETVACTDGLQRRDFLHTDDIAAALVHLLSQGAEGPFNVASGSAIQVRELIETTAELAGRPDLIELGARARPADDPPILRANVERLAAIGFRPQIELEDGLADCLRAVGMEPIL